MSQLHATIILKYVCWEFTQDHLPKGLKTLHRLFSWDFQYFPKRLELLPRFAACCSCCHVKWRPHACHAQQEISSVSALLEFLMGLSGEQ